MVKIDELNPIYLKDETKQKVRKSFLHSDFPAVMLNEFFSKEFYAELKKKISSLNFKRDTIVLHHSYDRSSMAISSAELNMFLSFVTKKKVEDMNFTVIRLGWKDYQILHDRYLEKNPGVDIILDITDAWDNEWGGMVTYTDGRGMVYPLAPAGNSLAIIERKKNLHKYFQYANHYAEEKKRVFLIATI
ncbi:MAG TPA: hypothetical protein VJB13_00120 [Candidatus Nanoarchaeia archaeon]|nr:hypothetical protein [Candidatus Nanoarchaeia archaeon]